MSKPDCSFVGWYTDEDYTKRVEKLTINNTTDNMILYAKWSDSHTHSWDSGVVTKQPTCTEAGTKTYTCTSCGKTKTTEIAATGHTSIPRFVTKKKQPARQRAIQEIPIVPIVKPKFLPDRRYLRPTIHGIMAR